MSGNISKYFLASVTTSILCYSCGDQKGAEKPTEQASEETNGASTPPPATNTPAESNTAAISSCEAYTAKIAPKNIEEIVSFINTLPKPTTVPCVISALPRPLKLASTTNPTSAQGATGVKSPRIFLRSGSLTISAVADGFMSDALEFSEILETNSTLSIKAEIKFPLLEDIKPSTPFERVYVSGEPSCASLCHAGHQNVQTFEDGIVSYASSIIYPKPIWNVSLDSIKSWHTECDGTESQLCTFYQALLNNGSVEPFEFVQPVN